MSAINELVLEAHEERETHRRLARERTERLEREREQAKIRQVEEMIEKSPLSEWLPDIEWEVYLPDHRIITPADRVSGTNPELTTATLELTFAPGTEDRVVVAFASSASDRDTHYTYWSGPEVRSAADIGEALERRIEQKGDQWLGHRCAVCKFRGNRTKAVGNGDFICIAAEPCQKRKKLVEAGEVDPDTGLMIK